MMLEQEGRLFAAVTVHLHETGGTMYISLVGRCSGDKILLSFITSLALISLGNNYTVFSKKL